MKKSLLFSTLLGLTLMSCHTTQNVRTDKVAKTQDKTIVVLFENDAHCNIDGYQKMAGMRDAIQDTAYCCLVSSGDYLQGGTAGAISNGQYIADIMRNMNYTAITLGNHEFDFGMARMKEIMKDINAPVTCCNLFDMKGKREYANYVMKQLGPTKVAFVGVTTPTTLYTEAYSFFDKNDVQTHELREKTLVNEVQTAVDEARKAGADYVIVLSHVGEDDNLCHSVSHDIVKRTRGIDAVLDGHTHSVVPEVKVNNLDGMPVVIAQTGTKFANIGKLTLRKGGIIHTQMLPVKGINNVNARIKEVTDSIKTVYNAKVNREICQSDVDINILDEVGKQAVRLRETNAGDLCADAYRYVTGAQIAISNGGGIRTSLKAGKVTYGDVIALLPYENYVEVLEVSGQKIIDVLNACTSFLPVENGDFPQVSGIQFTIDMNAEKRVKDVKVFDKVSNNYLPIDPNATYSLGTIDYCVTGGGLQKMLKNEKVVKQNIMLYSEALIEYVTKALNGHITRDYENPQGRITIIK
ncbi:MAG: bifunctional metallophosphatase/5'-nucleotidase [Bacteroidaceae bacterium]|nr:bifunctional metallophosphatase/5'-nucleotidase [Bacteroidaceae bacterium]